MPRLTIREKLADSLEHRDGWTRDYNAKTSKYWVYTHPDAPFNIYLGKSGACRVGKTATSSRPSDLYKLRLLREYVERYRGA